MGKTLPFLSCSMMLRRQPGTWVLRFLFFLILGIMLLRKISLLFQPVQEGRIFCCFLICSFLPGWFRVPP
ncbi:MAG: hypothetical protein D3909_17175 [Candidatus Electrothrix sp. ATG1]|nr:hypothetical protein [Candidatus Electrothrix sp. ATG1]